MVTEDSKLCLSIGIDIASLKETPVYYREGEWNYIFASELNEGNAEKIKEVIKDKFLDSVWLHKSIQFLRKPTAESTLQFLFERLSHKGFIILTVRDFSLDLKKYEKEVSGGALLSSNLWEDQQSHSTSVVRYGYTQNSLASLLSLIGYSQIKVVTDSDGLIWAYAEKLKDDKLELSVIKGKIESLSKDESWLSQGFLPELSMSSSVSERSLPEFTYQSFPEYSVEIDEQSTEFDEAWYLDSNPDVKSAGIVASDHYFGFGEEEGRKPNKIFDPIFYKRINSDVRESGMSLLAHYRDHGYSERRLPCDPNSDTARLKAVLFVGHDGIKAGAETVLLEIIKWFYYRTKKTIKLLLLNPGPLANEYARFAEVLSLSDSRVLDLKEFRDFVSCDLEFIYLNTVVAGRFLKIMKEAALSIACPVVTHIHEMEKVLGQFDEELALLLASTDQWISASPNSEETLKKKYKVPKNRIVTVPAFITPRPTLVGIKEKRRLARRALGISEDAKVVVGCGTVYWRKGVDLFIETARIIGSKSGSKVLFVWLGDGPDLENFRNELTEKDLSIIHLLGYRTDSQDLIACADVFFMSSREDPFPLVVLEAAQYKIPAVCFAPATGIKNFIGNNAGLVVNEVCSRKAAAAIKLLLEHPDFSRDLGISAYKKLFDQYTTEKQCLEIYKLLFKSEILKPSVSVVAPFFNHEKYARERIDSILSQTVKDIELLLLDDCSKDKTLTVLNRYVQDPRVKLVKNKVNSGSPFSQWSKGIELSRAEIIWIAEGDDSCDTNFLDKLIPSFADNLVNIAAAKTVIIDENGDANDLALSSYLNMAYPNKFDFSYVKDGFQEVEECLGASCTLVNASGLLLRKSAISNDTLKKASSFKMCGDWYIYLEMLRFGKIAYSVETRNLFRRHSESQVHKLEGTSQYFKERSEISRYVAENYTISMRAKNKIFANLRAEFERFKERPSMANDRLANYICFSDLTKSNSLNLNIALYVHGFTFSVGGIERLAAKLANYLSSRGANVTVYCRANKDNKSVFDLFDSVRVMPIFDEVELESSVAELRRDIISSKIDVFIPMLSEWLFSPIMSAANQTGTRVIASEHNDPSFIVEKWWCAAERYETFAKANAIHLLCDAYRSSLPEHLETKVRVIPNPVDLSNFKSRSKSRSKVKRVISVGRLCEQKRFDFLIKSAAQVVAKYPDVIFDIYGEGDMRDDLTDLITQMNLGNNVFLKGNTKDLENEYVSASIYALPSLFEGQSLTMLEAAASGLPIITTELVPSAVEFVNSTKAGIITKNSIEAFSEAIISLLKRDSQAAGLGRNAQEAAKSHSLESIMLAWENLINEVVNNEAFA